MLADMYIGDYVDSNKKIIEHLSIWIICVGSYAYGPRIERRQVAQEIDFSVGRPHFEIIDDRPAGIQTAFVPAIDDLLYLPTLPLIHECDRVFICLIAAVALHLDYVIVEIRHPLKAVPNLLDRNIPDLFQMVDPDTQKPDLFVGKIDP